MDASGSPDWRHGQTYAVLVTHVTDEYSRRVVDIPEVSQLRRNYSLHEFEVAATMAGLYEIEVFFEGSIEPAITLTAEVDPGLPDPACFVVYGAGLQGCAVSSSASFSVSAFDSFGNPVTTVSERDLSLTMECVVAPAHDGDASAAATPKVVTEGKVGNAIKCSYEMPEANTYKLTIKYQGQEVAQSPFRIQGGASDLSWKDSYVVGPHTHEGTVNSGVTCNFRVVTCDEYKNAIRIDGIEGYRQILKAWLEENDGADVATCESTEKDDGSLEFAFVPSKAGPCLVSVTYTVGGTTEHVTGSPFMLNVVSSILDPSRSAVVGGAVGEGKEGGEADAGAMPTEAMAGEEVTYVVQSMDKFGNVLLAGGAPIRCRIVKESSGMPAVCRSTIVDRKNGTYAVSLRIEYAASYKVHIDMAKDEASPFRLVGGKPVSLKIVPGPLSPKHCIASGKGICNASRAGEEATFKVYLLDAYGNGVGKGGGSVEVAMRGASAVPVTVADEGDGTYACTYLAGNEPSYRGKTVYAIDVSVGGHALEDSPFFQRVYPPQTSAYNSVAQGIPHSINAGETFEFVVQARDTEGNDTMHGMDPFFLEFQYETSTKAAAGDGASKNGGTVLAQDTLTGEVKDLHNGKYLVRLAAKDDVYTNVVVGILLGSHDGSTREHIRGSPFEIALAPSGLFSLGLWGGSKALAINASEEEKIAASLMVSGRGASEASAGEEAHIDLTVVRSNTVLGLGDFLDDGDNGGSGGVTERPIDPNLFTVELRGPQYIEGRVQGPNKNGHYHASYRCYTAGNYVLMIKLGKVPLPQCPMEVRVRPDVTDPGFCMVDAEGLRNKDHGDVLSVRISTCDAHTNRNHDRRDKFHLIVRGGSVQGKGRRARFQKVVKEFDAIAVGDGMHEARMTVPIEGEYSLQILHALKSAVGSKEIGASPVPFSVKKSATLAATPCKDGAGEAGEAPETAQSMKNLTQQALEDSGVSSPRKPNFLERRVQKMASRHRPAGEATDASHGDGGNDGKAARDSSGGIFSFGFWKKEDYWKDQGEAAAKAPLRSIQLKHWDEHKEAGKQGGADGGGGGPAMPKWLGYQTGKKIGTK